MVAKSDGLKGEFSRGGAESRKALDYEDEHDAIEPASDAAMLRHLMSAKAVSQAEIHQATGIPKSTISEVSGDPRTTGNSFTAEGLEEAVEEDLGLAFFVAGDVGGGPIDKILESAIAVVGHSFEYPRLGVENKMAHA